MYVQKHSVSFLNKDFLIDFKRNGYNLTKTDTIRMSEGHRSKDRALQDKTEKLSSTMYWKTIGGRESRASKRTESLLEHRTK